MQNSVHPGALFVKERPPFNSYCYRRTPKQFGFPTFVFCPEKNHQLGVVQVALLTAFALPKCLWQCSHLLLRTGKQIARFSLGGGPIVSHVPSNSPRLYGTWLCEHQKFTVHSSYCWFYIRWRWRNVWLTQASYYLRWKRPDIVRKKHAKRYYLLQNLDIMQQKM